MKNMELALDEIKKIIQIIKDDSSLTKLNLQSKPIIVVHKDYLASARHTLSHPIILTRNVTASSMLRDDLTFQISLKKGYAGAFLYRNRYYLLVNSIHLLKELKRNRVKYLGEI